MWLDYIRRDLHSPAAILKRLIEQDGLRGMTSNPAIFRKGNRRQHSVFLDILQFACARSPELDAKARYEILAIRDIQDAADHLPGVSLRQLEAARDGYVNLEVSPISTRDTLKALVTGRSAQALENSAARENLMIKVPGTPEGIPAFQQLINEGYQHQRDVAVLARRL